VEEWVEGKDAWGLGTGEIIWGWLGLGIFFLPVFVVALGLSLSRLDIHRYTLR
jgi:hypothetical protein